jgi:hypothetical protein
MRGGVVTRAYGSERLSVADSFDDAFLWFGLVVPLALAGGPLALHALYTRITLRNASFIPSGRGGDADANGSEPLLKVLLSRAGNSLRVLHDADVRALALVALTLFMVHATVYGLASALLAQAVLLIPAGAMLACALSLLSREREARRSALARSAAAGFAAFAAVHLWAHFWYSATSRLLHGAMDGPLGALVVVRATFYAFSVKAVAFEAARLAVLRLAVTHEGARAPNALLLHALAGSLGLGCAYTEFAFILPSGLSPWGQGAFADTMDDTGGGTADGAVMFATGALYILLHAANGVSAGAAYAKLRLVTTDRRDEAPPSEEGAAAAAVVAPTGVSSAAALRIAWPSVLLTGAWTLSLLLDALALNAFDAACAATPPTTFWERATLPHVFEPETSLLQHETLYNEFHNATKPPGFDDVENVYRYRENGELHPFIHRIDFVPPVLPGDVMNEQMAALCVRANPRAADLYDVTALTTIALACTMLLAPLAAALVAHCRLRALRRAEEHAARQARGPSPEAEARMAQMLAARGWVVAPPTAVAAPPLSSAAAAAEEGEAPAALDAHTEPKVEQLRDAHAEHAL